MGCECGNNLVNNMNMMSGSISNAGVSARRSPSHLITLLVLALCIAVPTTAFATPVERASVFPLHSTKAVVSETTTRQRHWKDGEYNNNASLASRLVFNYVAPLLDIAAQRRLETDDAFHVPDNKSMERVVTRLEQIYKDCRERSQREIMQQQQESTATDLSSKRSSRWTLKSLIPFKKPSDQFSASETRVLSIALLKSQKDTLVLTGILRLLNTIVQAFPALLIARLLRQIESGNSIPPSQPLISALSLVSVLSVKMVVENQYFHNVVKCACEVRGSLSGMIFDKSLRLSRGVGDRKLSSTGDEVGSNHKKKAKAKKKMAMYGSGGALNLMQSDAAIIEGLTMQLHTLWDGLLQISIYIALLYRYLGTPVIWGLSVLLATIPINAMILRILNRLNRRETEAKDARMKKTTESISNMQLLKLQSWESIFARDIENFREEELKRLTKRGAVRALNQAISFAVPTITLVATLFAYARMGKPIVASTIFTAISLFNQLRFPLLFYPMLIDSMANGKNSLRRISSYLAQEEIAPYLERYPKQLDGGRIEMRNGNFAWAAGSESDKEDVHTPRVPALIDANISVAPGEIVAVVGEVGSGKSALCKALIGELNPAPKTIFDKNMQHTEGVPRVIVQGSIAYCAQEAWLSKGTIRESVVFGREYDEKKYLRAIWAAGLDDDIVSTNFSAKKRATKAMLTHDTDVGEDGSNLSGGQRARVALARALYDENAGVYILDDVLSSLDSSVGSTVFERVSSRLRQQKAAAIFVTNDPNLPRRCDKVILMGSQGASPGSRIVDVGSYDDLISRGHDLSTIVHPEEEDSDSDEDNGDVAYAAADDSVLHLQNDMQHDAKNTAPQPNEQAQLSLSSSQQKLISTDDSMLTGAIPLRTYAAYFKSVTSPLLILAAVASYFVSNGSQFFQQMVIARWTDSSPGAMASVSSEYLNKLVYTAVAVAVSMYFRSYLTMRVGVRASKSLHRKMLKSIFEAPLSFFSTTPSGQLLTRFGKELDVVDRSLPDVVASVMYCVLQILFSTLALTGVVTPLMAFPLCLVGLVYSKVTGRFRPAARDLKRCESKSRSPIYTHFREALRGAETIRSFAGGREFWSGKHRYLEDRNLSVFYSVKALDRWLSVRLESLGNVVVFTAAVASIFLTRNGHLKSGSAGWGLTQALSITGLLTWAVRVLTDMETQFMSVERVVELTNLNSTASKSLKVVNQSHIPDASEEIVSLTPSSEATLLKSGWPWNGHVEFKNVTMRYTPFSQPVLQEVSVDIPAGTTVGIVGRTGSGKSSLLLTLFRLVEIEGAGSITIDGVDIRSLSPHGLRESLSIIPQSPTLFSGTLMYNLDASGRASADEAWSALEAASTELSRQFRESGTGLDTMISEGGENLSLGQRQLICLARALLKRSKILVLDEATSSVDTKTDGQVQETIRREFVQKGVTVITVAHRLDTVLGYDNIIVLDAGKIVEMGAPDELLKLQGGYLRRLASLDRQNRQKGGKQLL